MDRDRPMVDGRDLLESRLQEFLRQEGIELQPWQRDFLVQYLRNRDRQTDHVGTQDEASEARKVGDRVRSEPHLRGLKFEPMIFDEFTSEFTKQMALRDPNGGQIKPIKHCKLEKMPEGSIHAIIKYY